MTMIEKVAKALANNTRIRLGYTDDNYAEYNWQKYTSDAKAAIEAMKEPTEEMISVCHSTCFTCGGHIEGYQLMIEAALNA